MFEEMLEDSVVRKVGGRFKLATLIQKRLLALNSGARPLVEIKTNDRIQIVLAEIAQEKIYLDPTNALASVDDQNLDSVDIEED
jgi:DNA-directed RNA polymerase subunit omega